VLGEEEEEEGDYYMELRGKGKFRLREGD